MGFIEKKRQQYTPKSRHGLLRKELGRLTFFVFVNIATVNFKIAFVAHLTFLLDVASLAPAIPRVR